ncbi:hypothetical protein B0J13DRAFT_528017 [Dactylonectria estremocensis]|uniref:Uncharacterized protein n=1 Tax=Dactylonectria estremocensis TaxID=1079267 RepID=A0A9P9EHU6_9HYPO|nr:hypothetical protein B0J13DRAFT_528017 [Dactylonectria estremocensis]
MAHEDPIRHRNRHSDQERRHRDHWRDKDSDDLIHSPGLPPILVDPPDEIRYKSHRPLDLKHNGDRMSNGHSSTEVGLRNEFSHHPQSGSVAPIIGGFETNSRGRNHHKSHRKHSPPKKRSQSESAKEKAISTAAVAVFRIRNEPGSWAGEKGLKVAAATMAAASMAILLDVDKKKHPLAHIAVKMMEKGVVDNILGGTKQY